MAKKEAIAKLVKIKSHYLKLSQVEYSKALQDLYRQIDKVRIAREKKQEFVDRLSLTQKAPVIKSDDIRQLSEFIRFCEENVAREELFLREKEELAEILRKKMEEANKEKEIAQRLYKGILARELAEREKKERKVIDESATSRFFYKEE